MRCSTATGGSAWRSLPIGCISANVAMCCSQRGLGPVWMASSLAPAANVLRYVRGRLLLVFLLYREAYFAVDREPLLVEPEVFHRPHWSCQRVRRCPYPHPSATS